MVKHAYIYVKNKIILILAVSLTCSQISFNLFLDTAFLFLAYCMVLRILISQSGDQTHAPCSGSTEFQAMGRQGIPETLLLDQKI